VNSSRKLNSSKKQPKRKPKPFARWKIERAYDHLFELIQERTNEGSARRLRVCKTAEVKRP
jgi:hypothetical protein